MRLLRTIGGIDFTGQERAALNKLTMPSLDTVTPADVYYGRRPAILAVGSRSSSGR